MLTDLDLSGNSSNTDRLNTIQCITKQLKSFMRLSFSPTLFVASIKEGSVPIETWSNCIQLCEMLSYYFLHVSVAK